MNFGSGDNDDDDVDAMVGQQLQGLIERSRGNTLRGLVQAPKPAEQDPDEDDALADLARQEEAGESAEG